MFAYLDDNVCQLTNIDSDQLEHVGRVALKSELVAIVCFYRFVFVE